MDIDIHQLLLHIWNIIFIAILFLAILGIARTIKKFLFKPIDYTKGTAPQTYTGKTKYTAEARRAYESVTPKRKQDEKPPWEE